MVYSFYWQFFFFFLTKKKNRDTQISWMLFDWIWCFCYFYVYCFVFAFCVGIYSHCYYYYFVISFLQLLCEIRLNATSRVWIVGPTCLSNAAIVVAVNLIFVSRFLWQQITSFHFHRQRRSFKMHSNNCTYPPDWHIHTDALLCCRMLTFVVFVSFIFEKKKSHKRDKQ